MDKLVDNLGPVIDQPIVQPVFWGSEWNDLANQAAGNQIVSDVIQLVQGPYLRALAQYRNIQPASVLAPVFDKSAEPPPTLSATAIGNYLKDLVAAGTVLDFRSFGHQLLYYVFTVNRQLDDGSAAGYHSWDTMDDQTFYFAWSQDPSTVSVAHEIVEACTNPEGTGFSQPVQGGGAIEAADICTQGHYGNSDGIFVQSYWSNIDRQCIRPIRIAKVFIPRGHDCPTPPSVGTSSTFAFRFGVDPEWISSANLPALTNQKFAWSFDSSVATTIGSTDQPTLTLAWDSQPNGPTIVGLKISADRGITVRGHAKVRVHSQQEGELFERICRLRQLIDKDRKLPIFNINPLGPDTPDVIWPQEIARLEEFAKKLSRQLGQISELSRQMLRTGITSRT